MKALEKWLVQPDVSLALDPEWSVPAGVQPGSVIGSTDAATVNEVADYLARIVRARNLPQKVLIVHQFTEDMVSDRNLTRGRPEVALISNMDGFGTPDLKEGVYGKLSISQPANRRVRRTSRRPVQRLQAVLPRGHGPDGPTGRAGARSRAGRDRLRIAHDALVARKRCDSRRGGAEGPRHRMRRLAAQLLRAGFEQPEQLAVGSNGSATVAPSSRDRTARARSSTSASSADPCGTARPSSCASRSTACQSSGVTRRIVTASNAGAGAYPPLTLEAVMLLGVAYALLEDRLCEVCVERIHGRPPSSVSRASLHNQCGPYAS